MFKKLSYLTKSCLVYAIIVIILIGLSLIGLFWNNYYITTSLAISGVCACINMVLLIKSGDGLKPDAKKSEMAMLGAGQFIRFLMMFLAIGLSALVIYLTKSAEQDKIVYMNILASGVPFFAMTGVLAMIRPSEENIQPINENKETKDK